MPESLIFSMAGNFITPIINRNAIKAEYNMANARQLQAIYEYRKTVLDAFREVSNEMSNISNLQRLYEKKSKQVETLNSSIDISKELFKSAKANYLEVLMTQQEALDANLEMIETRRDQLITYANIYKALGGGWK
jgi:outer membrane protein TolC